MLETKHYLKQCGFFIDIKNSVKRGKLAHLYRLLVE